MFFLANFDPDSQLNFLKLMKNPKLVGMDTMNLWIDIKNNSIRRLMKKVNLFIVNDNEAKMITEETNLHKAAKRIRKMGPDIVVIKKGENGALVYSDKFHFAFSAYPVENVLDPTGAGDTFAGAIMGILSKTPKVTEKKMKKAILYATTFSSFNVEGYAMAKTANLTLTQVNRRKRELLKHIGV